MRLVLSLLFCLPAFADDASDVRAVIKRFNAASERQALVTRDASLDSLDRFQAAEVSQVFFSAGEVRFVTPDVAFVDAEAAQYGTMVMKRSVRAWFVLRREADGWRITILRIGPPSLPHVVQ